MAPKKSGVVVRTGPDEAPQFAVGPNNVLRLRPNRLARIRISLEKWEARAADRKLSAADRAAAESRRVQLVAWLAQLANEGEK